MGPARQGRERRQKDRPLRGLRHRLPDRLHGPARRRLKRHLQSRSVDGAEGAAQGRRIHRLRHVRGAPGARRRRLEAADLRRADHKRRADRLRHRRHRRHRRNRAHLARERPAPGVALLHPRPHHQSRLRPRVDRIRPQGPQPFGGHRLFDRRPRHRRRRAHGRARRCRRDGGGRHRIAGQPHGARRLRGLARALDRVQRRARRAPRAPTTKTATAS